jgi:hypothetical protein
LFDVVVAYESDADSELFSPGVAVEEVRLESGISKFDLTFAFAESDRGIGVGSNTTPICSSRAGLRGWRLICSN